MRELFPGRVDETMHLQTDRAAKGHGHARSFADARAYNLAKMWRKEKPAIRRPRGGVGAAATPKPRRFTEPAIAGHCAHANATLLGVLQYTCP